MSRRRVKDVRQASLSFRLSKVAPVYHGWRRVAYSIPVLCFVLILTIFFSYALLGVYGRFALALKDKRLAKERLMAEELRASQIEREVTRLKTPQGREEELRRNFQVARPGEGVIILLGTSSEN